MIDRFKVPAYENESDRLAWPEQAAAVITSEKNGLRVGRCPKCCKDKPEGELSLWPDPEQQYEPRFLCSGCRTQINRRPDTLYKDQMLQVLQACGVAVPDKLIQWTRVQCKIAEHPGGITYKREIDVEASLAADKLVSRMVEGGRTGARAGTGVVD